MDRAQDVRKGEELNWLRLEDYLRNQLTWVKGAFSYAQFHGGHANLTYLIKFGDKELVLRRPPQGKLGPGSHSMKREFRVLSVLYKHLPQAPRAYLLCENHEIIGADFIVMERRNGVVIRKKMVDEFQGMKDVHMRVTKAMVALMTSLHSIDIEKNNLSHLGKPEGFLKRQIAGWERREQAARTEEDTSMVKLASMLAQNIPQPQRVSIIHNDIKLDNCQFNPTDPDQVTSLFDWDMTTLGDPLVDLASTLAFWPDPYFKEGDGMPVFLIGPFPDKSFIKSEYARLSKLDLSKMAWYEAFAYWKASIIAQQLYKRYYDGETNDERMKLFGRAAIKISELAMFKLN